MLSPVACSGMNWNSFPSLRQVGNTTNTTAYRAFCPSFVRKRIGFDSLLGTVRRRE
jgi:hypothetical protein